MIISEKQIQQLMRVCIFNLQDFQDNFEFRMRLYDEIMNQQSDKLIEMNDED